MDYRGIYPVPGAKGVRFIKVYEVFPVERFALILQQAKWFVEVYKRKGVPYLNN